VIQPKPPSSHYSWLPILASGGCPFIALRLILKVQSARLWAKATASRGHRAIQLAASKRARARGGTVRLVAGSI